MSRVGKHPVPIPAGVEVTIQDGWIRSKGKLGELAFRISDLVEVERRDDSVLVRPRSKDRHATAMWGTTRACISNLVTGVHEGFTRVLEISGVGYRAAMQGEDLRLQLGFSHDVLVAIPAGLQVSCPQPTQISITGADRQLVGEFAARVRAWRRPEPYKGKGIRYQNEYVRRKEGKKK